MNIINELKKLKKCYCTVKEQIAALSFIENITEFEIDANSDLNLTFVDNNGVAFYTSLTPTSAELFFDCSIYRSGSFKNIKILT